MRSINKPLREISLLIIFVFTYVFVSLQAQAEEKKLLSLAPDLTIELSYCSDDELGVRFYCNLDWELKSDENVIMLVVRNNPAVTVTIAKTKTPLKKIGQLDRDDIQNLGEYADGFHTQIKYINGKRAVKVAGYSEDYANIRLLDYYFIKDGYIYSVLFSVSPKAKWFDYENLFHEIIGSFELL